MSLEKKAKMNPKFFEKLQKRVETSKSLLCIGLDPHVSQLTEATAASAQAFCLKIIEETHPYAAAFKPNSAFFEAFGPEGFEALSTVIKVNFYIYSCKNLCEYVFIIFIYIKESLYVHVVHMYMYMIIHM
jgi:orotidine-5'-phosphate decarboxylase